MSENQPKIQIKVKDLTTNHKVQLESGSWVKITSIERGMVNNTMLIHYQNGEWGNVPKNDIVEAIELEPVIAE